MEDLSAGQFLERLETLRSSEEREKYRRYFREAVGEIGGDDYFIGVRMGQVFGLGKEFIDMAPSEIEKLLESPIHEARAGALSIMDKQGRRKKTSEDRRGELYELYMRRHDRINNWDLVDLACIYVVGGYLYSRPRAPLYELAVSENVWERRTSIVSTAYFMRQGKVDDAFAIAALLRHDTEDLIHKAVGWMLRMAGDVDRGRLEAFLAEYAVTMPRTMLRYAIEHFAKDERERYLKMRA